MLAAMADAHGSIMHSHVTAVVGVKPATVLATNPYGDDQMREREVGDATVVAGHGRAQSSAVFHGHGCDGDVKCHITWARMMAMAGRGGRVAHGESMHVMDWMDMPQQWHMISVKARR